MMVEILDPSDEDLIIDPACGSGGFLIETLRHVWQKIDRKGEKYNWSKEEINGERQKVATENFRGIDKDKFLSKVTKAYMALVGDGKSFVSSFQLLFVSRLSSQTTPLLPSPTKAI